MIYKEEGMKNLTLLLSVIVFLSSSVISQEYSTAITTEDSLLVYEKISIIDSLIKERFLLDYLEKNNIKRFVAKSNGPVEDDEEFKYILKRIYTNPQEITLFEITKHIKKDYILGVHIKFSYSTYGAFFIFDKKASSENLVVFTFF